MGESRHRNPLSAVATPDPGSAKVHSMTTMLSTSCDTAFEELSWRADGLCAQTDPDAFFPSQGESARDAKRICAGCGVRQRCLEYAIAKDERFGIWGGLSGRERRRISGRGRSPGGAATPR